MAKLPLPIAGSSFPRPINEWINIVNGKKSELDSLQRTNGLKEQAAHWQEREFVRLAELGTTFADASRSVTETRVIGSLRQVGRRWKSTAAGHT